MVSPLPFVVCPSCLFYLLLSVHSGSLAEGDERWPQSLEFLRDARAADFMAIIEPLSDMTSLTYTATYGSDYRSAHVNRTVPGWSRGITTNPEAGMRALTFLHDDHVRGVVAFRGTDLGLPLPSASSRADLCADALLAGDEPAAYCDRFSADTLDYLSRALEHVEASRALYPDVQWLFTGHSLGAQLAEVVASVRGELALTFSSPPVVPVLQNRSDAKSVDEWQVVVLYNEWDPIGYDTDGLLVGSSCVWSVSPAPAGCESCRVPDPPSGSCELCFTQAHIFKSYKDLVRSGQRPACGGPNQGGGAPPLLVLISSACGVAAVLAFAVLICVRAPRRRGPKLEEASEAGLATSLQPAS